MIAKKNGKLPKKPLIQIAIPTEINGVVQGHVMDWVIRLQSFIGEFRLDRRAAGVNDVPYVRNLVCLRFLQGDADVLWFVDSDMDPRLGSAQADQHGGAPYMVEDLMRDDVDVVSGVSFRIGERGPSPCLSSPKGMPGVVESVMSQPRGLVDGKDIETGGACLAIKRHVLEAFLEKKHLWFEDHLERENPRRWGLMNLTEDRHFIRTAKELGFKFWVDTRICWGHIKPLDLREELWRTEELLATKEPKPLLEVAR